MAPPDLASFASERPPSVPRLGSLVRFPLAAYLRPKPGHRRGRHGRHPRSPKHGGGHRLCRKGRLTAIFAVHRVGVRRGIEAVAHSVRQEGSRGAEVDVQGRGPPVGAQLARELIWPAPASHHDVRSARSAASPRWVPPVEPETDLEAMRRVAGLARSAAHITGVVPAWLPRVDGAAQQSAAHRRPGQACMRADLLAPDYDINGGGHQNVAERIREDDAARAAKAARDLRDHQRHLVALAQGGHAAGVMPTRIAEERIAAG